MRIQFDFDSSAVRRPFDCLSKVSDVTRWPQSRRPIYPFTPQCSGPQQIGCNVARSYSAVELPWNRKSNRIVVTIPPY